MRTTKFAVAIAALCLVPLLSMAEDRPYSKGPVVSISFIKIKPGQYDNYMKYLAGPYRKLMDAQVKAGLAMGWKVYDATAHNPSEADVILAVTYPNMASFDKQKEFDELAEQVTGSFAAMDKAYADRGTMREVLGGQLIREVVLK
jgi:hypothetical protein